uniref:Uncharacterized protein n=2 Tax=Alexandrium andersonii TaxID=327968 RepID=A0A6U6TMQ8_9DINO|mmetsp:Transcript_74475/g.166720  ORF Transcript_74475/g.166720 Transcript_74475/m.166720 type:complete len:189 (+) Transcript_74475:81-647(+)
MFGVNAPHKRGLGAPTGPKHGHSDDEFVPDSAADREHRQKLEFIKEGKKMEKMLLATRSAVATAMVQAGGKMNLDAAGMAVMSGFGSLPSSASPAATCVQQPEGPPRKKEKDKEKDKDKKKAKKKSKKKKAGKKKEKTKKDKKKKKEKKKEKKKKESSSSSSGSDSDSESSAEEVSDDSAPAAKRGKV